MAVTIGVDKVNRYIHAGEVRYPLAQLGNRKYKEYMTVTLDVLATIQDCAEDYEGDKFYFADNGMIVAIHQMLKVTTTGTGNDLYTRMAGIVRLSGACPIASCEGTVRYDGTLNRQLYHVVNLWTPDLWIPFDDDDYIDTVTAMFEAHSVEMYSEHSVIVHCIKED